MLAPRESENRQQQKTLILTFSLAQKEKRKNKHKSMGAKEKRGIKNKKRLPFQLAFCWKQKKKKATTSRPANICFF